MALHPLLVLRKWIPLFLLVFVFTVGIYFREMAELEIQEGTPTLKEGTQQHDGNRTRTSTTNITEQTSTSIERVDINNIVISKENLKTPYVLRHSNTESNGKKVFTSSTPPSLLSKDNNRDKSFSDQFSQPEENSTSATARVRFTQFWSTGHVGTRYLTGLLAAPSYFDHIDVDYLAWNEHELPLVEPHQFDWAPSVYKLSLRKFQAMMAKDYLPNNKKGQIYFQKYVPRTVSRYGTMVEVDGWYGGLQVKRWNKQGDTQALKGYLSEVRMPALRSVYERYNREENGKEETLTHFVKVGHTAIFFDLSDYYEVLSNTMMGNAAIEVDFVRLQRNRMDVANSFLGHGHRAGPLLYSGTRNGIVTSPSMQTSLLKFASQGGPLDDEMWESWTTFQQYLWFCDEIEARWQAFLKTHPHVKHSTLAFATNASSASGNSRPALTPESIDDLARNVLELGLPLSPYMDRIAKQSHVSSNLTTVNRTGLDPFERECQALEYARQAPWCLQYQGDPLPNLNDDIPRLDCGLLA